MDDLITDAKKQASKYVGNEKSSILITGGFPKNGTNLTNFMKIEEIN